MPVARQSTRSSAKLPFVADSRSKFGERVNDQVRLLRQSWDRYLERTGGANWSGSAAKLLYGPDSLQENNYVRFDRQTNRSDFKRKDIPKVHPARFLYIPESDFSSPSRRQYNIDFDK